MSKFSIGFLTKPDPPRTRERLVYSGGVGRTAAVGGGLGSASVGSVGRRRPRLLLCRLVRSVGFKGRVEIALLRVRNSK